MKKLLALLLLTLSSVTHANAPSWNGIYQCVQRGIPDFFMSVIAREDGAIVWAIAATQEIQLVWGHGFGTPTGDRAEGFYAPHNFKFYFTAARGQSGHVEEIQVDLWYPFMGVWPPVTTRMCRRIA